MIKIDDINKSKELSSASKAKKNTGGESFSSYLNTTLNTTKTAISGTSGISIMDAIFATQMTDNEEEKAKRKHTLKRGSNLLEKLEEIRDSILIGSISKDRLIEISRLVKDKRFESADSQLNDIIEEIELRVEVELAKLLK